jgi:maltooligosyltrehalose trehalohydrolase
VLWPRIRANLGRDVELTRAPEPLLAPPENAQWDILWSREHPAYGGSGVRPLLPDAPWYLAAESAPVLEPRTVPDARRGSGTHDG